VIFRPWSRVLAQSDLPPCLFNLPVAAFLQLPDTCRALTAQVERHTCDADRAREAFK
jgi:hypothetical protein